MIIRPINDVELIKETFKKPYIWPFVHDDLSDIDSFAVVPEMPGFWMYLGVFVPDYAGFFMLTRCNFITYEIHTVLEKNCRGRKAIEAAKNVIAWVFSNTECERLITQIPERNILAEKLAIAAGMSIYGINEHSFKVQNDVQSVKLYGVTKG